jgi:hypothetical protein
MWSTKDSWRVFKGCPRGCLAGIQRMSACNVVILGHVKCGQAHLATQLSQHSWGFQPGFITFVSILNVCQCSGNWGRQACSWRDHLMWVQEMHIDIKILLCWICQQLIRCLLLTLWRHKQSNRWSVILDIVYT